MSGLLSKITEDFSGFLFRIFDSQIHAQIKRNQIEGLEFNISQLEDSIKAVKSLKSPSSFSHDSSDFQLNLNVKEADYHLNLNMVLYEHIIAFLPDYKQYVPKPLLVKYFSLWQEFEVEIKRFNPEWPLDISSKPNL